LDGLALLGMAIVDRMGNNAWHSDWSTLDALSHAGRSIPRDKYYDGATGIVP